MSGGYEAIVIGGGHNGVAAGGYLAREGVNTVVLEAPPKGGGGATAHAPRGGGPGVNVTTFSVGLRFVPPRGL